MSAVVKLSKENTENTKIKPHINAVSKKEMARPTVIGKSYQDRLLAP